MSSRRKSNYNWHYETLAQYDVSEKDILNIKRTQPNLYKTILTSEWNRYCEEYHFALDFTEWRKRFAL